MKPHTLQLDKALLNSLVSNTIGDVKNEILFKRYLNSWRELVEKSLSLKDFLELNAISEFSKEDIYHLDRILDKTFIRHGDSEFIGDSKYLETFTILFPTNKEQIESKYKKNYCHGYMLRATKSKSYYISFGIIDDQGKPGSQQYTLSNFYLADGALQFSLESFFKRGFWLDSFSENFTAIFRALLSTVNQKSKITVKERKQLFTKNVFKILFKESLETLSFDIIKKDFESYFNFLHRETYDQYDPNLLNIVVKQRYGFFITNPRLVLEEEVLKPIVDARHSSAGFYSSSKDPQSDFFDAILSKKIDNPYAYKKILNYNDKKNLLLDIIRSQFALNYLGKISFSASYLIRNRNNPKKETLYLLRKNENPLYPFKTLEIFKRLYPDLVNYLKLNFG